MRDFTKPPVAGTKGSSERGGSAEPAKAAGIAPWNEPEGNRRKALGPKPRPERVPDEASAPNGVRESGKAFGRSRDPKGDRRGFGLDANPQGDGAASAGPDPQGKRRRDFGSASRPAGDRRGASCLLAETHRDPNGATRLAAGSGGSGRGVHAPPRFRSRPARDGLATQRRQSKLGQVGAGGDTGPH